MYSEDKWQTIMEYFLVLKHSLKISDNMKRDSLNRKELCEVIPTSSLQPGFIH